MPVTGGVGPAALELQDGYFVMPTVFDGVNQNMRIAQKDIFGPVMPVIAWRDIEDVPAQANSLSLELTTTIVTRDLAQAMKTAERIEAGYVWINGNGSYLGAPYGGWKHSGPGAEETFEEMLIYIQIKNVHMRW